MSKRIILWLAVIAHLLALIGLAVFLPAVFSTVQTCTQAQLQAGTCTPTVSTAQGAGIGIGILLFIAAGILATIAWIGALIRSAKMHTWVWFVVILLAHGLGTLIYAIAGPSDRAAMAAAYPFPGYPIVDRPPQYPRQ